MENLRGAKIVKQDSSMVENSHLYIKAKDENYCELTIVDENGNKRKVGAWNAISGADSIIELTYGELVNLKDNSQLKKGQVYLLTDYETTYIQPATNINKTSGVIEPLIITATDVNKLHNQCKSTLYPQDIVYYEITGDIGNGYGTEGFTKGKIYRRIDTHRNNDIGTDWRHVKYNRNGIDKLLFQNYNECYNNTIKTYHLFDNVVGESFSHNIIGDFFVNNTIGDFFSNNNIGDTFANNIIVGEEFIGNIIKNDFYNNHIGGYFSKNIINGYFRNNVIGEEFIYNTVGAFFINVGSQASPFISRNTEFRNFIQAVSIATPEIQNLDIDVTVFKSPNGTLKQRYYDDSNNLVINNL